MALPNITISPKKKQPSSVAGEFISKLLLAAAQVHVHHLTTKSFAAHKALNELYDALPDLADGLAESMQNNGIITGYAQSISLNENPDNAVAFIESLRSYVETTRKDMPQDSYVQNQIDSIVEELSSTLYKLKFLS